MTTTTDAARRRGGSGAPTTARPAAAGRDPGQRHGHRARPARHRLHRRSPGSPTSRRPSLAAWSTASSAGRAVSPSETLVLRRDHVVPGVLLPDVPGGAAGRALPDPGAPPGAARGDRRVLRQRPADDDRAGAVVPRGGRDGPDDAAVGRCCRSTRAMRVVLLLDDPPHPSSPRARRVAGRRPRLAGRADRLARRSRGSGSPRRSSGSRRPRPRRSGRAPPPRSRAGRRVRLGRRLAEHRRRRGGRRRPRRRFFADQVLRALADDFSAIGRALRRRRPTRARDVPTARMRQLYRRLAWTFQGRGRPGSSARRTRRCRTRPTRR